MIFASGRPPSAAAAALRREGKSRREIRELLGPMSNSTLNEALQGVPPPDRTSRPNAKDHLRAQARELRTQGLKYGEIASRLGVSKGSVSLWVRDLPRPPKLAYHESRRRCSEGVRRYWESERAARDAKRIADRAAAAAEVGSLTDREIIIAGAIAYWFEGEKRKPDRRSNEHVVFINSDPGLIRLFLRFLDTAGVPRNDLAFCVHIHETTDTAAAQRLWLEVTGTPPEQFQKPALKRHNPKTNRKNVGADYHGCLRVTVHRSSALCRKIEGWASAAMGAS
jgi:hypothetical protein